MGSDDMELTQISNGKEEREMAGKKTYRVGFLVMPQFSMIALSCVMDPLREASRFTELIESLD